jgi:broad specificity phosphatase PhoE
MKKYLLLSILMVNMAAQAFVAAPHSIYLVRHSEKQNAAQDPALTQCGLQRAEQLATMLSEIELKAIYSTDYRRTMATAMPSAKQHQLAIKKYLPSALQQLATKLNQQAQNVLVVGHSNTTPQLAELLSGQKVTPLTEQDYQMLYQIQFVGEQVILTLFKQPLICS